MKCHYCGWHESHHSPICQKPGSPEVAIWERGRRDGRQGKAPPDTESNPVYWMGWVLGNVTLEEAQNGHDPRFH